MFSKKKIEREAWALSKRTLGCDSVRRWDGAAKGFIFLLPFPPLLLRLLGTKLCEPVTFPETWYPLIAVCSLWPNLSGQLYKEAEEFRRRRDVLHFYLPKSGRFSTTQTWLLDYFRKIFYFPLLGQALNEKWRLNQIKIRDCSIGRERWSFPTFQLL